jgi:hypothetical protein
MEPISQFLYDANTNVFFQNLLLNTETQFIFVRRFCRHHMTDTSK